MINKRAIAGFLDRKLDNFDWLKKEKASALDAELSEGLPKAVVKTLWFHQKVCLIITLLVKRFMIYTDMGGGKTRTALYLLWHRKLQGERVRAIVMIPFITSHKTWIDEAKGIPGLVCCPLMGTAKENMQKLLSAEADLFTICYQSAVAMLCDSVPGKRGKNRWQLNLKLTRKTFNDFDTLIMDEIHNCKNQQSLTYRLCRAITNQVEYALGLTGTPFGKDLQDLWAQFYLIDFGDTLGPTLGFFRAAFFNEKVNWFGGFDYTFKKSMLPELTRMIKNVSIRFSIEECYDMPPRSFARRMVPVAPGAAGYIEAAMAELKKAIAGPENKDRFRVAEASYLQLRQLASGFMTLRGEDSAKVQVTFDENPKLDELEEMIDAMPYGRKMIVFHHFVYTNQLISDRLKAMKVKHARVWSGQRDPLREIRRFQDDPECTVLVINSKSGSSSLNLQVANYVVFYEQPDSPIDRQQAERRAWRPGQERKVFFIDLLTERTADERMLGSNLQGKKLLQQLLDNRSQL